MVHITCDLCGKSLAGPGEPRFVVRIEAYPGCDPAALTEADLDDDPMVAVSELMRRDENLSSEELAAASGKAFRYDLCPACHVKFVQDPLGRDMIRTLDFSQN